MLNSLLTFSIYIYIKYLFFILYFIFVSVLLFRCENVCVAVGVHACSVYGTIAFFVRIIIFFTLFTAGILLKKPANLCECHVVHHTYLYNFYLYNVFSLHLRVKNATSKSFYTYVCMDIHRVWRHHWIMNVHLQLQWNCKPEKRAKESECQRVHTKEHSTQHTAHKHSKEQTKKKRPTNKLNKQQSQKKTNTQNRPQDPNGNLLCTLKQFIISNRMTC